MLYLRGKSANLLSIGAVDFGIIVDSSVIMVENIYRNLAAGNIADLPLKERILRFVQEIDHALLFSTLIMVCAFVPLFTMTGPEGQLFGPMAQTYAFSLAGALVLALTLTPVLCMLFFKNFKPVAGEPPGPRPEGPLPVATRALPEVPLDDRARDGVADRRHRLPDPAAGPRVHARAGGGQPLDPRHRPAQHDAWTHQVEIAKQARAIMATYPEVESIVTQIGRPDDGTDTEGYYSSEYFVPLRPQKDWPG